ncbi:hypothetical protein ANN_03963 [Periplaneta americana]|uniref:Uncharacterized protein n=1 Tax=Periplaneta americana TaxID=6978 RepID=A0ABQ8T796_PERAM|nr:hypothetical protein ANN_03963 [Periplaneta americana]
MAGLCEGGNEPPGSLKANDFIVKVDAFVVNNEKVELPKLKWKLKPGSVSHIFPNLHKYLSTPIKSRKRLQDCTTPRKRMRMDEDYLPERSMTKTRDETPEPIAITSRDIVTQYRRSTGQRLTTVLMKIRATRVKRLLEEHASGSRHQILFTDENIFTMGELNRVCMLTPLRKVLRNI